MDNRLLLHLIINCIIYFYIKNISYVLDVEYLIPL